MSSIFTKIVKGEIPAYKIAETESCLAFLDVFPIAKGHVLVIPKKEVDYIFDLDDDLYQELMNFTKHISKALKKSIPCLKIGVAVVGLEVPHAHVHLVPINNISDLDFTKPKLKLSEEELIQIRELIKSNL